jgi:hypothetical protein
MQVNTQVQGWHVTNWGLWGWAETALKAIGIGAGVLAFIASASTPDLVFGGNPELAAIILLALLTLGTVVALGLRLQQREIISIAFSVFNILGHIGLFIALLRVPDQNTLPVVFGVAYVLGELTKQRFLSLTGYTEAGQNSRSMVNFSRGLMAFYALFILLIVL